MELNLFATNSAVKKAQKNLQENPTGSDIF